MFPLVAKNGVYLVEDLHAAYWSDHGGGLHPPDPFIERAKSCVDEMHAEYRRGAISRSAVGDRTTSISFYDSVVVFEVGEYRVKGHRMTGNPALFDSDWTPVGETPEDFRRVVADALGSKASNERRSAVEVSPTSPPAAASPESAPVHEAAADPGEPGWTSCNATSRRCGRKSPCCGDPRHGASQVPCAPWAAS
jgi:hypothetical protein